MKNIIEVTNVSKRYSIGREKKLYSSLRDDIVDFIKHPIRMITGDSEYFWPLKDITFNLEAGETLGIIGPNGAGKSTLLKILSRVTSISEGEIILRGRVGSLLEVGTGFHPELTGRDNIYLNGSVMGLTRKEITERFDSIVSFSGTEKFLDTPIKHYSTGMFTRLAFSIAAHLDPDILIVDEVLSVGDLSFQNKAMDRIKKIGQRGKTVIFVSHNMEAISKICTKTLWLEKGNLAAYGETSKVIASYVAHVQENSLNSKDLSDIKNYARELGHDTFKFTKVAVKPKGKSKEVSFNEPFDIEIQGKAEKQIHDFMVGFSISTPAGITIFNSYSIDSGLQKKYSKGNMIFKISLETNILLPGQYIIHLVALGEGISLWLPDALVFTVLETDFSKTSRLQSEGFIAYPVTWRLT